MSWKQRQRYIHANSWSRVILIHHCTVVYGIRLLWLTLVARYCSDLSVRWRENQRCYGHFGFWVPIRVPILEDGQSGDKQEGAGSLLSLYVSCPVFSCPVSWAISFVREKKNHATVHRNRPPITTTLRSPVLRLLKKSLTVSCTMWCDVMLYLCELWKRRSRLIE